MLVTLSTRLQPDLKAHCLAARPCSLAQQHAALGVPVPHSQPHRPQTVWGAGAARAHLPQPAQAMPWRFSVTSTWLVHWRADLQARMDAAWGACVEPSQPSKADALPVLVTPGRPKRLVAAVVI